MLFQPLNLTAVQLCQPLVYFLVLLVPSVYTSGKQQMKEKLHSEVEQVNYKIPDPILLLKKSRLTRLLGKQCDHYLLS